MVLPFGAEFLERALLSKIRLWVGEGMSLLKKERAHNEIRQCMDYVEGRQFPLRSKTISHIVDNRIRKIVLETVSSLTDVRPIWNYETSNETFKDQGEILNKLARGWWKNGYIDRRLQSVLTFACVGGSGYAALTWDPSAGGNGDLVMVPYDPRDVIPIEPIFSDSVQDWRGVILRQRMPTATVQNMYPIKAHRITGRVGGWFGALDGTGSAQFSIKSAVWNILTRNTDQENPGTDYVDFLRIFVKDDRINTGSAPVEMGEGNWAYTVYPVGSQHPTGVIVDEHLARLYPRGRMIVCTPEVILEDGPNPFWHGMFPVVRFSLDPLPWSLLGASMVADLIPMQDALNEALRGVEDGVGQWVRRGVVADRNAISNSNLQSLDTRKAGLKAHVNPTAGEGFKIIDGPQFPDWYLQMIEFFKMEIDENSGVRGLQQLAQLKQMPSADSMEKFMDALSPMLRLRARSIEVSLAEMAEMLKVGFFQYYDAPRRFQVLGPDGLTLQDFDYDPDSLIPGPENEDDPTSREDRAQTHHRNFTFSIMANSFLNISHSTQKLMMLQLLRANLLDPWTAWETFDLANAGKAPAEHITERIVAARRLGLIPGPTPEMVQAQEALVLAQAQAAMGQAAMQMMVPGAQGGAAPPGGAPPGGAEVPNNNGVGPQGGRPPSGQQAPTFQQKDGGSRVVVSESGS